MPLQPPRGVDPPSLLRRETPVRRSFAPLVETYAIVPYADMDPSVVAGVVYVVMFGAMFGDAGHGLLLLLVGLLLRWRHPARLARFHAAWPFVVGAALAAIFFGVLYGEFFGPTGVLPVLWLSPVAEPVRLLLAAIGFGAVLLAGAYVLGTINRWREGGVRAALYAPSGLAGAAVFLGLRHSGRRAVQPPRRDHRPGKRTCRGGPGIRRYRPLRRRWRWCRSSRRSRSWPI